MCKKNPVIGLLLICTAFIASAAVFLPQEGNGIHPAQSLGIEIYRQFVADNKILTAAENPETETVNRIGNQVIDAVKKYYAEKKTGKELAGFQWEIGLFSSTKADAWCLPGGKIAVYAPLLSITQSDASLAVVISHTIAHVLLKHGDLRMKQYLKDFLAKKDLSMALSAKPRETRDFFRMAYGNGDYVGVIQGFRADDEAAADALGAIFCARAGYHPAEALVFWERMAKLRGTGRQPALVSTHPVDERRIERLAGIMDDLVREHYRPISKK